MKRKEYKYSDLIFKPHLGFLFAMVLSFIVYATLTKDTYLPLVVVLSILSYGWSMSFGRFEIKKK